MKYRNYVMLVCALLVIFSGTTVTLNYLVDPFLVFGSKRIDGFNKLKAAINDYTWVMKTYHPVKGDWNTLLLGNSRVEIGFDPEHRCFADIDSRTYNLGVPGANIQEQLEFAANVIYQQPIEEIFLSVDFSDFLRKVDRPADSPAASNGTNLRYRVDGSQSPDFAWRRFQDRYQALFTLDALSSSLLTIATQKTTTTDRTSSGFNPALDFASSVDAEGPHALFSQKMDNLDSKFSAGWSLFEADGSPSGQFSSLDALLELAISRNIRVTIIASPFHASYWEALDRHGLLQSHQQWKEMLLTRLRTSGHVFTFWDFTGPNEYSQEPVPDAGVLSGPLNWYWEPVHFRSQLGDLVLESVLSDRCEGAVQHFGEQLL